ncbi:MAG: lysylphosphatidylglycerol synthase domain-containing protein, partial [Gemmatimonadota bacterium]|nr:lysylphosphatidylglycerol synthase domain-containing protein [Gemmatimonadota bacterium]
MTPSPGTRAEAARTAGQLQRVFRTALWVVPFGVLANIGFSLAVTDRATLASLGAFPRGYLFLAVALGLVPWVTNALRLGIWTRFIGHPLRFRDTLRITLGTELGSSVTPTASGGGLFRWGMLMGHGVSPGAAASVISLGVMEDALFFLLAVPTALLLVPVVDLPVLEGIGSRLGGQAARIALWGALFALAVLAAAIAALRGRFGRRVQRRGLRLAGRGRRRARATGRDARHVYALVIRR